MFSLFDLLVSPLLLILAPIVSHHPGVSATDHSHENRAYLLKSREMFRHAYHGYMKHAYPEDELQPLSCTGISTWGNFSLTLIDSLDSLVVFDMYDEFRESVDKIVTHTNFSIDKNVSVFETNIRVVGGLLSAHLLMERGRMELPEGWPCNGPLLDLAVDIARRLLPAFATPTGLPYGTVNLMYGVPKLETTVTGTAGCGTFLLEFGMLSRLTGDPTFEHAARRALKSLYNARSVALNLVGNHIDITRAEWIYREAGIGGNVDSYYEYLLKGGLFFEDFELISQFKVLYKAVVGNLQHEFWYIWTNMYSGMPTLPSVSTLDAFWPSLQILIGDIKSAGKTLTNFYSLISHYGFTPEAFSLLTGQVSQGSEIYPLRPEFVESLVYMYQATGDQMWRNMGKQVLDSIELSTRTPCGYATVSNVVTHQLEDRMESFFLSETTKYLYLLFSDDHWIFEQGVWGNISVAQDSDGEYRVCAPNSFGYTFTTEAHPFPAGVLGCCYPQQKVEERLLNKIYKTRDPLWMFSTQPKPVRVVFRPHLPSFPLIPEPITSNRIKLSYPLYRFLIKVAGSHDPVCFESDGPLLDAAEHFCKTRPWYSRYEIYGAEWNKLAGKRAFRVINNKDSQ